MTSLRAISRTGTPLGRRLRAYAAMSSMNPELPAVRLRADASPPRLPVA
ncbi:hypothetical protein OHS70_34835 [Streptomyces sp. NBC_00390]